MEELLSKNYIEYRQRIREFATAEVLPIALEQDAKEEFPVNLAKKMGQAGLFGITIPKEYGGQGLDYLSYIIAVIACYSLQGDSRGNIRSTIGNKHFGAIYNPFPINQVGTGFNSFWI